MSERLCKDCKHYRAPGRHDSHPQQRCHALDGKPNMINGGDLRGIEVGVMRMTLCGWQDPKLWEKSTDQDSYPTG